MSYICTSIVATLVLAAASFAATINVPADQPTIQGAINASSHGDVIAIAAGTYYEANLNSGGKAITIQGTLNSNGSLATTIDAQQVGRVWTFSLGEGPDTMIKDLMITGGISFDGGGIYCNNSSSPTFNGCTIENNLSFDGGGIHCNNNSNPAITGCTILGNEANNGGGIYCNNSSPTITDCTIEDNTADFDGAGIYCETSSPSISGCTISDNTARSDGGGIHCYDNSNPDISGCTISDNTNNYDGGGICCDTNSNPTISECIITGNSSVTFGGSGGGICSSTSSPVISQCTITGNIASNGGGILTRWQGMPLISDCIITGNTAESDGGGVATYLSSNPTLINCVISQNTTTKTGGAGFTCNNSNATLIGCTIEDNNGLAIITSYAGAVHVGPSSHVSIFDCSIMGNTCPSPGAKGGGISCRGYSSISIADSTITGNNLSYSEDSSNVNPTKGGGIYCQQSSATMNNCTISNNAAMRGAGVYLYNCSPPTDQLITNCRIMNNTAHDQGGGLELYNISNVDLTDCIIEGNTATLFGGGANCSFSNPTFRNCVISSNTTGDGGGICCNGNISLINCTISNNTAERNGGGIYHDDISSNNTMTDTTVCGNAPDQVPGDWTDNGGNLILDECPLCPGDATGDFFVDVNDVRYVLFAWGSDDVNADFDENGLVDVNDVLILLSRFGEPCP